MSHLDPHINQCELKISKDHSFAKSCKSITKCIHWYKESDKVTYLSVTVVLMYLVNCSRLNITFSINLLARYSFAPTWRHWNGIKQLLGYADVEYLLDPHKDGSQIGYVFNCNGTTILWRSVRQIMKVTSSNHSEIHAIHKASPKYIWLRSMI